MLCVYSQLVGGLPVLLTSEWFNCEIGRWMVYMYSWQVGDLPILLTSEWFNWDVGG